MSTFWREFIWPALAASGTVVFIVAGLWLLRGYVPPTGDAALAVATMALLRTFTRHP